MLQGLDGFFEETILKHPLMEIWFSLYKHQLEQVFLITSNHVIDQKWSEQQPYFSSPSKQPQAEGSGVHSSSVIVTLFTHLLLGPLLKVATQFCFLGVLRNHPEAWKETGTYLLLVVLEVWDSVPWPRLALDWGSIRNWSWLSGPPTPCHLLSSCTPGLYLLDKFSYKPDQMLHQTCLLEYPTFSEQSCLHPWGPACFDIERDDGSKGPHVCPGIYTCSQLPCDLSW